ncbi:MAG: hypothetical protein R3F07_11580 [Opitutaceae bacterium]
MKLNATLIASSAVIAMIGSPPAAKAGDEAIAAIGGFIGGVIVGTMASDSRDDTTVVIDAGHGGRRDGNFDRGRLDRRNYSDNEQGRRSDRCYVERHHNDRADHGRWVYRTELRWVPGYWSYRSNRCGETKRIWIPGRHVTTRVRVWVSVSGDRHHCGRG